MFYFIGINDLYEVYQECKQLSAKWDMIGLNLGVAPTTIAIINRDNPNSCERCMYQMLAKWLQRENETCVPTWRNFSRALRTEVGRSTADQILKYHVTDCSKQRGMQQLLFFKLHFMQMTMNLMAVVYKRMHTQALQL